MLSTLWTKYGCSAGVEEEYGGEYATTFMGEFMEPLTDGLKALGSLFWVRKNLLEVKAQYKSLCIALYSISESKALEKVLRRIHSVMYDLLTLRDDECVRYNSIPSLLNTTVVISDKDDGSVEQERLMLDIVLEKMTPKDIAALVELYEVCVPALGVSPDLLTSRFCQIEHAFHCSLEDIQRMGSYGEKNALAQVCVELNRRLGKVRRYGFKTTDQEGDFGVVVNAWSRACGMIGEDAFGKGGSAENVVANTIEIVRILVKRSLESSDRQECICQ